MASDRTDELDLNALRPRIKIKLLFIALLDQAMANIRASSGRRAAPARHERSGEPKDGHDAPHRDAEHR